MENWLVLVAMLSTEDPASRMRVLRTLESLGAAVLREGVYVLPDTGANRRSLDALVEYAARGGGACHALEVRTSGAQEQTFRQLFDRSARYDNLIKTVQSLRVGFGQADPSAIARVLHKQRREFEAIATLDFFPSQARSRAQQVLVEAEDEVRKLMFPTQPPAPLGAGESLQKRAWATRKPLWADRLACAWLVRRFVDPEARLAWLDKGHPLPPGALGFGFEGAHFAAAGERVAYEEMVAKLELGRNPALVRIGGIVHFLEVGGRPVPEAAGVQTLLQGATRRAGSEQELLAEAEKTFDLLYEAYFENPRRNSGNSGNSGSGS